MKRLLYYMVFGCCLSVLTPAYGLDDKTYLEYKNRSPLFRYAESKLNRTWKQLKAVLNKNEYKTLLKHQRRWLRSRDNLATNLTDAEGLSKVEAYSIISMNRTQHLEILIYQQKLYKGEQPMFGTKSSEVARKKNVSKQSAGLSASPRLVTNQKKSFFFIDGEYLYKESGCSGGMKIQENTFGMYPHIIAKIDTVCTGQYHTCVLTSRGGRIISSDKSISANFVSIEDDGSRPDNPAKFTIEFTKHGATVDVSEKGGYCGLNGWFGGKWVKEEGGK